MRRTRTAACALAALSLLAVTAMARPQAPADTPAAHREAGWKAYGASDYKAAKREFSRAVKLDKADAESVLGLALVARLTGRHGEALKQVGRALAIRPDYAEAHYVRGRLFYDDNEIANARAEGEAALKLTTELYAPYALMGDVLIAEAKYEEALASFEQARRVAKADFDAVPRLRDRYEAVKAYVAAKAARSDGAPGYVKPQLLNRPRPEYTESARAAKTAGKVKLMIHFTDHGDVARVIVATGLPDGLTENAIRAARELRAMPATLAGRPVDAWATVVVNFSIR